MFILARINGECSSNRCRDRGRFRGAPDAILSRDFLHIKFIMEGLVRPKARERLCLLPAWVCKRESLSTEWRGGGDGGGCFSSDPLKFPPCLHNTSLAIDSAGFCVIPTRITRFDMCARRVRIKSDEGELPSVSKRGAAGPKPESAYKCR